MDLAQEAKEGSPEYWPDQKELLFVSQIVPAFLESRQSILDRTKGNLVSLDILAIDPAYQRKGVGARLVEWGTKKADDLGFEACVESSIFGKGLYVRL